MSPAPAEPASRHPLRRLRERMRQWWHSRLPRSDHLTLTQRNVYILPTRPGLMLATTLLVLLVASINYQLNLGYLLTFLLAGCALAGMHIGHATLRGLQLQLLPPSAQFCGQALRLDVLLNNPRRAPRHGLGMRLAGQQDWVWTDVPGQGQAPLQLAFLPTRRGLQNVPVLNIETRFPLGTFRVWAIWRPAAQVLIYPQPEAHPPPLPPGEPRSGPPGHATQAGRGQDFEGVRPYRRGDSLKQVVWKKTATALATGSSALVSRDSEHQQPAELWLDQRPLVSLAPEAQLSRLCAWVLQAEQQGLDYGLRLLGQEIAPGQGAAHQQRCLEALALC
ncbi:DUF58 domain-containing protein [Curvibacter sp. HBC61]|uniref:DUF58 domain-containing protein n=1 Tax=Curvibacter cyanobacteriorum TaxID=3026422 RepID=A0ABT5MSX1_9BURK|nr:DUF58 domain-containing protein [Curvibacter sp. HBC61]MDD0837005.1 DUF58 domain-containing protein [Curvibacter sp. HBC61]